MRGPVRSAPLTGGRPERLLTSLLPTSLLPAVGGALTRETASRQELVLQGEEVGSVCSAQPDAWLCKHSELTS